MSRRRTIGKDIIILTLLVAAVFGFMSFMKDTTITGQAVEPINQPPVWTGPTSKFFLDKNSFLIINLDDYFTDPEGAPLTFIAAEASSINTEVSGQQLKLTPEQGFLGERMVSVYASDGQETTKQTILVDVLEVPQEQPAENTKTEAPAIQDTIKDQNGRSIGKKIEEDYTFNTIIDRADRTSSELIIRFHHNANDELPVWIEGWADYTLSKTTALPEETITLTVPLAGGIVPKFKLHVGQTSDVFEFGKTIPTVQITDELFNSGQYEIYDRDDDYVDIEITKGESRAVLNAVDAEEINAKIGKIEVLKTEVIAIDSVPMGGATITLAKTGKVSVIRACENFNIETFKCLEDWHVTDIPFTDLGDSIVFTVTHFSAYAGGTATNLTIWDDSDFSTQYTGTPMSFYANFTNSTGPANNTNGSCRIRFNTTGTWGPYLNMTFNATGTDIYNYTAAFATQGTPFYYEINCTGTGENLAATDAFYVYQFLPNQGLFSCTHRTGIACLPGETKVLGMSATTNAHAELPTQSNYNTSICCQDLSGRNTIYANGTAFLNLSNTTNAHVALPNTSVAYNFSANISASNDTLTCNYTQTAGICTSIPFAGCLATISSDTNAHVSECTKNQYNRTICCWFPQIPLNTSINVSKNVSPSPATIGSTMTYTILLQNTGPGTAHNITVNESYPNGTSYISAIPAPSAGNNTWNFSSLAAGANTTITITLRILSSVTNGTFLNNTVNVTWQNDTGGSFSRSANASVQALSGLPARRSSGGWPATEGARQYYQKLAEETTTQESSCREVWTCTSWGECIAGQITRTCTDRNACGTAYSKPDEAAACIIEQPAIGQATEPPAPLPEPRAPKAEIPEAPEIKKNQLAAILPFITYGLIILLAAALLIHLIREHFLGKRTRDTWYYLLYALLALSGLAILTEAALARQVQYPVIFAIAAIVMVLVLDALLRNIPSHQKPLPEIPQAAMPTGKRKERARTEKIKKDELDELSRKLKELKV